MINIFVLSAIATSSVISSPTVNLYQNSSSYNIEYSNYFTSENIKSEESDDYYTKEIGIKAYTTSYNTYGSDDMGSPEYYENMSILREFLDLEDNWDEYGALAPSEDIVMFVMTILSELPKQPDVFPTPEGHVQLEYVIGRNRHLNIEIISETKFSVFEMFEDRTARKDFYSYDLRILNDRIRRFYGIIS